MTVDLEQFNRDLDQLLNRHQITSDDAALQTAVLLLSLDFDSAMNLPADLRARWIACTKQSNKKRPLRLTLRTNPAALILLVLLGLAMTTGAVFALGKFLGYIPGVGFVDQNSSFFVLEKPVRTTKNGITLEILQVVANSEHIVIRYSIDAPSFIPSAPLPPVQGGPACKFTPDFTAYFLQLPDGTQIPSWGGGPVGNDFVVEFPPISSDIDTVTVLLGCDLGNATIHLVPGSTNEVIPVIPLSTATVQVTQVEPTPSEETTAAKTNYLFTLNDVVNLNDGYILTGVFQQLQVDATNFEPISVVNFEVFDVNDSPVAIETVITGDVNYWSVDSSNLSQSWAIEILGTEHAWPIKIFVQPIIISQPVDISSFTINLGEDPQAGESWNIDLDIPVQNEGMVRVNSVRLIQGVAPLEDPNSYGLDFSILTESYDGPMIILRDKDHTFRSLAGGGGPEGYTISFLYENGFRPSKLLDISVLYQPKTLGPRLEVTFQP